MAHAEQRALDLHFWFDPVCPFAWMTSKWVRMVAARRTYTVEWRFVSLRLLNAHVDYDAHFPPDYEGGHTDGLRLLRVAARVREEHGRAAVAPLYEAMGQRIFEADDPPGVERRSTPEFTAAVLADVALPTDLAAALDDESWDAVIRSESDEALARTGRDVGTPILQFRPPDGVAFFGPVISRLPGEEEAEELWDHVLGLAAFPGFAEELWDHVLGLAAFPGFAELKRSLRERPQLPAFGVRTGETGIEEDWHGGSRRLKR